MRECFSFRFLESDQDKRSSLAIFFSTEISLDSAVKAIKKDVEESFVPKNIYIMAMAEFKDALSACKQNESFNNEFDSFVGDIQRKLIYLFFKPDGEIVCLDDNYSIPSDLKITILQTGMICLFKKHKGVITSSPSYHFVKPSGDHADKFIRTSNLLVSSIEVTFLAISLLPYLKANLKRIYVDTSSISYLVNIAVHLSGMFSKSPPFIESFESYAVFNQKYDFVEDDTSLVIISATTSGSLTKSLKQKHSFNGNQIVSLLHLNLPADQVGIFNVSAAVEQITSKKEADCEFCKRGSKIIRISGDQFLPETPKHELLVIKKTDFNKQRKEFFEEFATKKMLGWNTVSDHQAYSREHFYIDVEKILADPPPKFSENLDRAINRYVSRHVNTVIFLNDIGSEALSKRIRKYLGPKDAESISWLKFEEVNREALKNSASVVVVAGAITSGRKLLAASRELRCIPESASILYLVGFSKLPTTDSLEQLKKDLRQGGHECVVLTECPLPRVKENTKTAWDWETEELNKWSDPFSGHDDGLPTLLNERVNFLTSEANDPDKLFLPDSDGNNLALRNTFVFWSDLGLGDCAANATQSDVYWTIQSVLHDLRIGSDQNGLSSTYHTTLISPACFDRYNDGVIQACLLRAAKPVELNYAVDSKFSRQMTDVIYSVISNWSNPHGEATLEFLLALWTERLRLIDDHLKNLLSNLTHEIRTDMPEEMLFFLKQITDKNITDKL